MDIWQVSALLLLALFYLIYFGKMLVQRQKGIETDQMGKGAKAPATLRVERALRAVTFAIVPVEVGSIVLSTRGTGHVWPLAGMLIAAAGVAAFALAVLTMRDSWRAGIPERAETSLVQHGIYRLSRNPAFLGFDLLYIGCVLAFPNAVHILFVCAVIRLMHLQILQEEKYLAAVYGEAYQAYKARTGRYFWWI